MKGIKEMMGTKMITQLGVKVIRDFLKEFDSDRTIGSITDKEIKIVVKTLMEKNR
jgi:hypothetical protein